MAVSAGNADREWLYARGRELIGDSASPEPKVTPATAPPGFPPGIQIDTIDFSDWSGFVQVSAVLIARVTTAEQVAALCNWAAASSYTVRAVGEGHNWSPLLMVPGTPARPRVLLVDTTQLTACGFAVVDGQPLATFGTGITIDAATAYLEQLDNGGASAAPGYGFAHIPAPGNLTLGGVLAIGGHGTLVPSDAGATELMGCLSNFVTGFDAVVTNPASPNPTTYTVTHFDRSSASAAAFLVHLGRAFITAVTVRVVPNYYLQLTPKFPTTAECFAPPSTPPTPTSFAGMLDEYGRVEALWFPYTSTVFAQCNRVQAAEIQPQVPGPYNYPWMNDITPARNALIRAALFDAPWLTPGFGATELAFQTLNLTGKVLNGTSRDLELYLKDSTLRVTLFGWALQISRADVQGVANQFFKQVQGMLVAASTKGVFPVNAAIEIRCNTLDGSIGLPDPTWPPPALAATRNVGDAHSSLNTVIWLNVGSITATPGMNDFYTELEDWMLATWGQDDPSRLRPEWSKAWAYSSAGPWTDTAKLAKIRASFEGSSLAPYTWAWAADVLARADAANLFSNPLLDTLFSTASA